MTESLYRKYRPQTFADVVGQDAIERTLRNALSQDKVSHAYLFTGPRGTGKTTTARLMAKAILCDKGTTPDPDGTCESCQMIAAGTHPDVYELDAASRTGVENVREEIIGRVNFAPTIGRAKIYIIDEVHMLSTAAFNALLKTLEEPPDHVVFILCTTDPQKVPATIHSRCQRFDFHRISDDEIVSRLGAVCVSEDVEFEPEALALIAARSDGGMRNALTTLEQLIVFCDGKVTLSGAEDLLGSLDSNDMAEIVRAIGNRDARKCFEWTAQYVETGADLAQFVEDLAARVRTLYVMSVAGENVAVELNDADRKEYLEELRLFGTDRLARLLTVVGDLLNELRNARNPRLAFEIALTRMVHPTADLTIEALAERVEELERALARMAQGGVAVAASVPGSVAPAQGGAAGGGAAVAAPGAVAPSAPAPAPVSPANAAPVSTQANVAPAAEKAASPAREAVPEAAPTAARQSAPQQAQPAPAPVTPQAPAAPAEMPSQAMSQNQAVANAPVQAAASAREATPVQEAPATPATPAAPAQPAAQAGVASGSSATAARILANNAELQRSWKAALDRLKAVKPAYAVLFMNVNVAPDAAGNSIEVTFPAANNFAYAVAGKPEVYDELERAIAEVFGAPVTVRLMKAGEAAAAAPAPAPAAAASAASAPMPHAAPAPVASAPVAPAQNDSQVFIPPTAPAEVRERAMQGGMNAPMGGAAQAPTPASPAVVPAPASAPAASDSSWDEVPVDVYDSYADEASYDDPYGSPYDAPYNAPAVAPRTAAPRNVPAASPSAAPRNAAPAPASAMPASRMPASAANAPASSPAPAAVSPDIPEDSGDINGILASAFGDSVSFEQVDDV